MQLRSPFDLIASASRDWLRSPTSRAPQAYHAHGHPVDGRSIHRHPIHGHGAHVRAVAMARKHPEELGVVLRLVAVMAFFSILAMLVFWLAG